MKSRIILLLFSLLLLAGSCVKPKDHDVYLFVYNRSSYNLSWELIPGHRDQWRHEFLGAPASTKEELLTILRKETGSDNPSFTFWILDYENSEAHEVGSIGCEKCNFDYSSFTDGLLGSVTMMYDYTLNIDDSLLSEAAAANGVDFSSFEGMKKK